MSFLFVSLPKYVARSALLDYLQMVCRQIAKRHVDPPAWWDPPPPEEDPPKLRKPDVPCYEDKKTGQSRLCTRCQEEHDSELQKMEQAQNEKATEMEDQAAKKKRLRARMRKRAKEGP